MSRISTHVLDATTGTPAAGVAVVLLSAAGEVLGESVTDDDGRTALGPEEPAPGEHRLELATGAYFAQRGVPSFHPRVVVVFTVGDDGAGGRRHVHVPLLLSPFAYSTYRGS